MLYLVGISSMDKQVFNMHNRIRANPKMLIPHLEELLTTFVPTSKDGKTKILKDGRRIFTKEGPAAVKEAIQALKKQEP